MSPEQQDQPTQGIRSLSSQASDVRRPTPARNVVRRAWLIVALAVACGTVTWYLVRDDPKVYERTLSFVILPSARLDVGEIPDALRSLDQQNSQISGTIAAAIGSKAFLRSAGAAAVRRPLGPNYEVNAGVRPGSDALSVRVRGPNPRVLAAVGPELSQRAVRWVDRNMRSYRLQRLDNVAPTGPVAPKTFQLIGVAAFLGAALAFGAAYAEGSARARRARDEAAARDEPHEGGPSRVVRYDTGTPLERRHDVDARRHG